MDYETAFNLIKSRQDTCEVLVRHWISTSAAFVQNELPAMSEDEIRDAVKRLGAEEHLIVEAAAATAVAALLSGRISAQGRRVACVISGANTDVMM